jgi:uncharacterized phiE125 gp8 family phage protein
MWYPATIAAPATEPVTSAQAKVQCRIESTDTNFDTEITRLITAARAHVEKYCNVRFGSRSAVVKCDRWTDMARLPDAPVTTVTSISYVDADGVTQTLATTVYELRGDDLEAGIVLKYAQAWPSIQPGSRITLTADVGYSTSPPDVVHAMLIDIADMFHGRESEARDDFSTLDALLINHRRGV